MGDLTKNFSLDEFLVSSTAAKHKIANTPTDEHLHRIREMTAPGMQIIRELVGRPVIITSGYRNPTVNSIVGGVPNSDHAQAYAADSRAAGLSTFEYAHIIKGAMELGGRLHGKVDQLILETSRRVVHVSFAPRLRGEVLTQKGRAGTRFESGLVA